MTPSRTIVGVSLAAVLATAAGGVWWSLRARPTGPGAEAHQELAQDGHARPPAFVTTTGANEGDDGPATSSPETPEGIAAVPPPPPGAPQDPDPPDRVLAKLEAARDRADVFDVLADEVCACQDSACIMQVNRLGTPHLRRLSRPTDTSDDAKSAKGRFIKCVDRILANNP